VNFFLGRRLGKLAGWLASAMVAVGFVIAVIALTNLLSLPEEQRLHVTRLFHWIGAAASRSTRPCASIRSP